MRTLDNFSCVCNDNTGNKWEQVLNDYIKALGNQITKMDVSSAFINWAIALDNNGTYDWSALLDKTFPGQDWSKINYDKETSQPVDWAGVL